MEGEAGDEPGDESSGSDSELQQQQEVERLQSIVSKLTLFNAQLCSSVTHVHV